MNNLQLLNTAQKILAQSIESADSKTAWETAFSAIGLAHFNWEAAAKLITDFFKSQHSNGFLPYYSTSQESENITPPPIWGYTLWSLYQQAEDKEAANEFLREMFPKVIHFHQYLYEFRDPNEEGLCHIESPLEDVLQNNPHWALAAKNSNGIFQIQDPFFNAVLVQSNEALIEVADVLKEDVSELVQWKDLTIHTCNEKLWDEEYGIYNAWDLVADKAIPMEGISGFMPLFGGIPEISQALQMLDLIKSDAFTGTLKNTAFLCPTLSLEQENLDVNKIAAGAISLDLNWLLSQGFQHYETPEFLEIIEQVKTESLQLLTQNGFHQYFNPYKNNVNNAGLGEAQCPISAAILLNWLL